VHCTNFIDKSNQPIYNTTYNNHDNILKKTGGHLNMDQSQFAKQMIDFQKTTFDNLYDSMVMLQDHTQKLASTVFEQATWLPEESSRLVRQWIEIFKKGRNDYKSAVDDIFTRIDDWITAENDVRSQI
jgi:hypothetical protein